MLERRLDSRIWGGAALGTWLGLTDTPPNLAESWQVYEHNRIVAGPYRGRTLAEVAATYGVALVGTHSFSRYGADFPLLAKFIDAGAALSVQVHPDDGYAHRFEAASGFHGKTEAWHILQAAAGADVVLGLKPAATPATFAAAAANGGLDALLRRVPVSAGDTIYVPAGTVHAINAGILLFEIQQKSDLTYRVYDYGRLDAVGQARELHLNRALEVITYEAGPPVKTQPRLVGLHRSLLVSCPYFAMERWALAAPVQTTTEPTSFEILTVIEGAAYVAWPDGVIRLVQGESVVLPACLGAHMLHPDPSVTLLRCYVPEGIVQASSFSHSGGARLEAMR